MIGGRLLGGNLEMLSRLCGTPLAAALTPGEPVVPADRRSRRGAVSHRSRADAACAVGALRDVVALVVGDLVRCQAPAVADGSVDTSGAPTTAPAVIGERAQALVCRLFNAPLGHGDRNRPVPLGSRSSFTAARARCTSKTARCAKGRPILGQKSRVNSRVYSTLPPPRRQNSCYASPTVRSAAGRRERSSGSGPTERLGRNR